MNYQIYLRLRNPNENNPIYSIEEQQITYKVPGKVDKFIFDHIFESELNKELLQYVQHDIIIFYGQQGSGKSFTLYGTPQNPGIMVLTIQQLLRQNHQLTLNYKFITQQENKYVTDDMTTINIYDIETVWQYIQSIEKQNLKQHLIIELVIDDYQQMQFLEIVSPERSPKDVQQPQKYQDSIWLSSQLQSLAKVLNGFSQGKLLPLTESQLTRKLCMNNKSKVLLFGIIYPTRENYEETLYTLQFLERTRNTLQIQRKESITQISHTQQLEKQVKSLEYENKDLKQQIFKVKQEYKSKLSSIKDILNLDFDLEDLTSLSFTQIQEFKNQKDAYQANENIKIIIKEQEQVINQLNETIKQLKNEFKIKSDSLQQQVVEWKHKLFLLNEQSITQKTELSEQIKLLIQDKQVCLKQVIQNSNKIVEDKTNKITQLPQNAHYKQIDNNKLIELRKQIKQELENEQQKNQNSMKNDYENTIKLLNQKHEHVMKEKSNEMDQFIMQYKMYREKKKNLIREMKDEMLQMYQSIQKWQEFVQKIENGGYGTKIQIPKKDKPTIPSEKFYKHLFHFIERKAETTTKVTKSSSAEKTFLLTPINNRVQRSYTQYQEKQIVFDLNDLDSININLMDIPSLKQFIVKLKELYKQSQNDIKVKEEQFKQKIIQMQKERDEVNQKYNQESRKYNLQRVAIESQNRLITKLRPSSSIQRKQS